LEEEEIKNQEEITQQKKSYELSRPSAVELKGRNRFSQFSASILVNALYEMKNYPVVLVNTVLSPLSFLVLIEFVSRGALLGQAIEGGFIMSMFSAGMSLQGDLSHLKNDFKLQDMVVSSPTTWKVYLAGMAISELVYSLPALIVLGILAGYYLPLSPTGLVTFVAVLLLMFLASIAVGYTFATFSSDIVQSFAFSRLLSTLFSTLPPVYYPISYIPRPFEYLAYLSPTTYAALLAQNVAGFPKSHLTLEAQAIDWIVLIAVTVALFLIASRKARWREI
jgi:ABC-2 type transport system permease protein